jgi:uncharacterized surface protein with fasciclin (FAS1) repeats
MCIKYGLPFKRKGGKKMKLLRMVVIFAALLLVVTPIIGCATTSPPPEEMKDIVDIAVEDGRFTTLVAALEAADLVATLKGEGPFTVFAPTDDAFNKLPAGTVEGLLEDIPALANILLYHVVSGKVMAADVVKISSADTVSGESLTISVMGDKVMINDAQVIITDIEASNGVIHVIDTVLLP